MIASIDIETFDLDATQFKMGCLMIEGKKTPEFFWKKEDLWNRVLELGKAQAKRKRVLNIYSHNASFDFYGYANLTDKNLKYFCHNPFIVSYTYNNKEIIKFLDSMSLYRMSLAKMANLIGMEKGEIPLTIIKKKNNSESEKRIIEKYCALDTEICLKAVCILRDKLKEEGVRVKRLYTVNQIAINYIINELRKQKNKDFLDDIKKGIVWNSYRIKEIHEAYRGGRNQAFKIGKFENVNYVDVNSLYPYACTQLDMPKLRTERKIHKPLDFLKKDELFNQIGISKCLIYNKSDNIGLLPIRTNIGNYYPKSGKYLYGTWTHLELKEAINNNYEIIHIEWSITWETGSNPFKLIMENLYNRRKGSSFNKYFYKQMMNAGLGKMAQHRLQQEIIVKNIEDVEEYIQKGYNIIKGVEFNMMLEKKEISAPKKKYYMPIIPTLVNAWSRVYLYKYLKKVGEDNIIYSDTDSIFFKGDGLKFFKINQNLGGWKIEAKNGIHKNYGKKTYYINEQCHVGGIHSSNLDTEKMEKGIIMYSRMNTLATTKNIEEVGSFIKKTEDLNERANKSIESEKKLAELDFYIDENTEVLQETILILKKRLV